MWRGMLVVLLIVVGGLGLMTARPDRAAATHAWTDRQGNVFHWARAANPVSVRLGDNLTTTEWKCLLGSLPTTACSISLDGLAVSADWDASTVLDTPTAIGTAPRPCRAVEGTIQVCNDHYGRRRWLGLAQIWTWDSHIVKATAKVNDTYFDSPSYTATMKQHVLCQEIGHGFGLDHQDESGADLNTCMDYSSKIDNRHPDAHDWAQLETIYTSHVDAASTVPLAAAAIAAARARGVPFIDEGPNEQAEFGRAIRSDRRGRPILFERELGGGARLYTWVIWA